MLTERSRWMERRLFAWLAVALHATGGTCLAGLAAAAWVAVRTDPIVCVPACPPLVATAALVAAVSYFVGTSVIAAGLGMSHLAGGVSIRLRSWMGLTVPPLAGAGLYLLLG